MRAQSGAVFEWAAHVQRTASSAAALLHPRDSIAAATLADAALLRPMMAAVASAALHAAGEDRGAAKITVLATLAHSIEVAMSIAPLLQAHGGLAIMPPVALPSSLPMILLCAHAAPLARRHPPPVVVELQGSPRHNALAKDSAWVVARRDLEAARGPGVEEQLLCDAAGGVLEGTQTNFFALCADGSLRTAPAGAVLEGTVRGLVIELCTAPGAQARGLPPLRLCAPTRDGAVQPASAGNDAWLGAFLTSTSRLVMPIDELRWPGGGVRSFAQPRPTAIAQLERLVEACVAERSTDIAAESRAGNASNCAAVK